MNKKKIDCNCNLWKDALEAIRFKENGIPEGFCGLCDDCGKPGHIRQSPIGDKPTISCDICFKSSSFLRLFSPFLVFGLIALAIWFYTNNPDRSEPQYLEFQSDP